MQHEFLVTSYTRPTYCDVCKGLLVGLLKQGLQCQTCSSNVHKKCVFRAKEQRCGQENATKDAVDDAEEDDDEGPMHHFDLVSFTKPTSCAFCLKFIWGLSKQGYSCSSCMYPCHAKCLEDARSVPCSHTPANGRRREDSIILESEDVAGLRDQVLVSDRQSAPIFLVSLDIHLSIMKMLCIRDILSCAKTCRFMLAVTSKPALWPHGRNILSLRQSWLSLTPRLFKDESNYHFPDISYLSGIGQQGERVICACKHGQYFRDTSVLTIDSTTGRTETVDVSVGYLDVSDPRGGIVGWGGSPSWEAIQCISPDGDQFSWEDLKKRFNSIVYRHPFLILASAFWEHERDNGGDTSNSLRVVDVTSDFQVIWRHDFEVVASGRGRNQFLAVEEGGMICSSICSERDSNSGHSRIFFHRLDTGEEIGEYDAGSHGVQSLSCNSTGFIAASLDALFLFSLSGELLRKVVTPFKMEVGDRNALYHTARFFSVREGYGAGYDGRGKRALVHVWDANTLEPLVTIDKRGDRSFHSFGILDSMELLVIVTTTFCKYDYTLELYSIRTGSLLHTCKGLPCNQNSIDGPDSNVVMTPHALWFGEGGRGGALRRFPIPLSATAQSQCSIQ